MSKRSVTFTKPEEPNFLKQLKQQIGYQEGPTLDTKREDLGPVEDAEEAEDEQPQIVVLQSGDLTAEEASKEKERLEREAAEAPADLTAPIVFKAPKKGEKSSKRAADPEGGKKSAKKAKSKTLLSFDEEENDD